MAFEVIFCAVVLVFIVLSIWIMWRQGFEVMQLKAECKKKSDMLITHEKRLSKIEIWIKNMEN